MSIDIKQLLDRLFALNSAYQVAETAPYDEFTKLDWLAAATSMSLVRLP